MNFKTIVMALLIVLTLSSSGFSATNPLTVHFIDVGQADCIFIHSPDGHNMLIDAGNNDDAATVTSYLAAQNVVKIDVLIGTHPHEDHIGSMDTVIQDFEIGQIYLPKVTVNNRTFADVLAAVKQKGLKVNSPVAGSSIAWDSSVQVKILAPNSVTYDELNDYSIVLQLVYGETKFMFTGDAEQTSEKEILARFSDLKVDVLKVGHHGSNSSTTAAFLKAVAPQYAVISLGKYNQYGYPSQEVTNRLEQARVKVYRTDNQGTIMATSSGKTITFSAGRSRRNKNNRRS
jgi:competence protein ComEC